VYFYFIPAVQKPLEILMRVEMLVELRGDAHVVHLFDGVKGDTEFDLKFEDVLGRICENEYCQFA
jgi:hypothetical protein